MFRVSKDGKVKKKYYDIGHLFRISELKREKKNMHEVDSLCECKDKKDAMDTRNCDSCLSKLWEKNRWDYIETDECGVPEIIFISHKVVADIKVYLKTKVRYEDLQSKYFP